MLCCRFGFRTCCCGCCTRATPFYRFVFFFRCAVNCDARLLTECGGMRLGTFGLVFMCSLVFFCISPSPRSSYNLSSLTQDWLRTQFTVECVGRDELVCVCVCVRLQLFRRALFVRFFFVFPPFRQQSKLTASCVGVLRLRHCVAEFSPAISVGISLLSKQITRARNLLRIAGIIHMRPLQHNSQRQNVRPTFV